MTLSNCKKKILVISGSRSDYGLIGSILNNLKKEKKIDTKILVTGSHLEKIYGYTYKEIEKDGFKIDYKIFLNLKKTNKKSLVLSFEKIIKSMSKILIKLKPDAVLVLGDRYEIFSAAFTSYILGYKIFHFAGGEETPYVYDNDFRKCITNLASHHFVAHKDYKKKLIKIGINKNKIFNIGNLGIDKIKNQKKINKKLFIKKFKIDEKKPIFLVTFHPTTNFSVKKNIKDLNILLSVLEKFNNFQKIFTLPPSDVGSDQLRNIIIKFCKGKKYDKFFYSLGVENYLNFAKISKLIIGNSSSGISEIPSLKKITINIGKRQKGRIMGNSVLSCDISNKKIEKTIKKGITISKNKTFLKNITNPFGNGNSGKKALKIIKKII